MIRFEKEVIKYLGLPSIPKREHDGTSFFDKGVAIVVDKGGEKSYAVCRYTESDKEPIITKVFDLAPFVSIENIYVVPTYMNNIDEVKNMDLDEPSKKKAEEILREAKELEDDIDDTVEQHGEYYFDNITNDEEARAFIASYNKTNRIKGCVPKTHEGLVMRLASIYSNMKERK